VNRKVVFGKVEDVQEDKAAFTARSTNALMNVPTAELNAGKLRACWFFDRDGETEERQW